MKRLLSVLLLVPVATAFAAAPQPANVFGSGMVLQRDAAAPIWGTATPGSTVRFDLFAEDSATAPKDECSLSATADETGRWEFRTPRLPAGGPYTLSFTGEDGAATVLSDVLFGDVWICSGQSNMEMNYWWGLTRGKEDVETNVFPTVRLFIVPNANSGLPQPDIGKAAWKDVRLENARDFSACGYFFGEALHKALPDVPIGLVDATWSGTIIETWISYESLEALGGTIGETATARKAMADRWLNGGREAYADELAAWSKRRLEAGATNGVSVYDSAFPDAGLGEYELPSGFGKMPNPLGNSQVWFRRTVTLTAQQAAASNAVLSLGPVDDEDYAFVNGKQVGHMDVWNRDRVYPVEQGLLREGENHIAVLVINWGGRGGFLPERAKDLALRLGDETVPLAGPWKYLLPDGEPTKRPESFDSFSNPNVDSACYNAMIRPLFPMAIKGAIWYQGCSNVGRAAEYERLFPAMLADWRAGFSGGEFPFYAVQLASFQQTHEKPYDSNWARMRWTQAKMADSVPHYDFATALDVGEHGDIHPKDKKTVGERLAKLALAHDYGFNDLEFSGPRAKAGSIVDNEVVLYFTHAEGLATTDGEPVKGFQLVDATGKAVWVQANIEGDKILLTIPEEFVPTMVRHAWDEYPLRNLVNAAGLPCGPFEIEL